MSQGPASASRLLLLAVWFGLLAGILEVVLVQVALRSGVPVRLSADYVWMAPAADVLFAVLAALVLIALGRLRPAHDRLPAAVGVFSALLVLAVALHAETLHRVAVLLLAAGIGSAAASLARFPRVRRLFPIVPLSALLMALLVAWLAIGIRRQQSRRESAAAAALPAAPAGAMNLLLLILDTVRQQSTGLADVPLPTTPALDALARRGVTFARAIAPSPWTLPSHASFFTGRLPQELSAGWTTPLDGRYPTLAEYLGSRGYATAGFVGNLEFATRASGLGRGFVHYDDYQVNFGQLLLSSSIGRALAGSSGLRRVVGYHELLNRRGAADVTGDFLAWQARQEQGRPFFAFLNYFDAHEPYFPRGRSGSILWPGPRWTRFEHVVGLFSGASAWISDKETLSPAEVTLLTEGYHRAVSAADAQLGRLLAELERRSVLNNTLVVIAGDHGEQLGEHRLFEHINSLYLPALQVPLVIVSPRGPQGLRVAETVALRDLPATMIDLLALSAGTPLAGRSLAVHWTTPGRAGSDSVFSVLQRGLVREDWYPIGRGPEMFSLTTNEHHYIRNGDQSEELYELGPDPGEARNLAADPSRAEVLQRLRGSLLRLAALR